MALWPFGQGHAANEFATLETSRVKATPSEPHEGQAALAALAALLEPFQGTDRPVTARTDPGERTLSALPAGDTGSVEGRAVASAWVDSER